MALAIRDDTVRQWLNLLLSAGQIVTTVLCFYLGTSFDQATQSHYGESPITPAGYAFTIWSLIYGLSLAFGIWQMLPSKAQDPVLRRVGYRTAAVFLGTNLWLVLARFNHTWLTFFTIVWMLVSLYRAWMPLWKMNPRSLTERILLYAMLGIFSGWITVATFANFASAMKASGWADLGFSETTWCVLLLALAGVFAIVVIRSTRSDAPFTLTILWALTAIVSSNANRFHNRPVLITAAVITVIAGLTFFGTLFHPDNRVAVPTPRTS